MIKEFKDFLFRGNIVELAVAFVMGLAFEEVMPDEERRHQELLAALRSSN